MKKLYILSLFTAGLFTANAQNVGIGTTNPETKLQVEGALSLKPSSGTATAGNIEIPTDVSVFRIANDGVSLPINVTSASPKEGQTLTIYNSDPDEATFNSFKISPNNGVISCSFIDGAWRLVSDNSASGNNFIKNQTGAQTGANFNISGNGTIGGNLTTTGTATVTGATSLNGGATVSGATNINTSGSSITNIGTGTNTGAVTLGNSSNNINLPKLNASSIVRTDASKNLTTGAVNLNSADVTGTLPVGNLPNLNGDVTGAITSNTIANNAVNSAKIADGSIVNADINAAAAIADTKLATISTAGKVLNSATTATNANTANAIVARDASGNFSAGLISANLNGEWQRIDDRTISPNEITSGFARFGFTSWNNNNTAPYADFLHLRSYTDASGGNDNLIMFRKDAIGMRIYQQTWNSGTAYSSFKDVAFADGSNIADAAVIKNQTALQSSANFNISGAGTFGSGSPITFTSIGTGTYNRAVIYHNSTDGLYIERARTTDVANGTITDFQINQRGGGTPALIVKGSGNVGVGTASPSTTLDVNGAITSSTLTSSGNRAVYANSSGTLTIAPGNGAPEGGATVVPLPLYGDQPLVRTTNWSRITMTTYSAIASYFAGVPVPAGATRKYYVVIRKADSQPGGIGSRWRFSCDAAWNSSADVPGHGFSVNSDWGSISEGTIHWIEIPATAVSSAGCGTSYWKLDARMENAGQTMKVFSVSLAAIDVMGGTNAAYSVATSGTATNPLTSTNFGYSPLGSIMAWHKSFSNTPGLPDGWVECNGQVLSDVNSIYNGQTIPNLNSGANSTFGGTTNVGRFLRGATTSGTFQSDQTADLQIEQSSSDQGSNGGATNDGSTSNYSAWMKNYYWDDSFRWRYTNREVRPLSFTVVWIMRVK